MRHPLSLLTNEVPALPVAPGRTALVLQDLHRPFADSANGRLATTAKRLFVHKEFEEFFSALPTVVENAVRLLAACRRHGIQVEHLRWTVHGASPGRLQEAMGWTWRSDELDSEFLPELMPERGEHCHTKAGWGALSSDTLVPHLRRGGIECVVLAGVPLDFGIRQTCFELADCGFGVLLATDATTALTQLADAPTRGNLTHGTVKQRSTAELLDLLGRLKQEECVWV